MERKTTSNLFWGAGFVLSALLAVQLVARPGANEPSGHGGHDLVEKTWVFTAANMGEARNLATDVVLGRVATITPAELVVPIPGEPNGEDRIATDVVAIDVQKAYKGSPGARVSLLHTRGVPDLERDGDDANRTPPPSTYSVPDAKGALTDDPPYAVGEQYVLFLRPGRALSDLRVTGTSGPSRVILAPEGRYLVRADGLRPVSTRTFSGTIAGKTLSQFEGALAALDSDGDGVKDGRDNCPALANPAQTLPAWPVPADDPDCDGFPTKVDNFTGRLPLVSCAATRGAGDERRAPWPADVNDDRAVDDLDVKVVGSSLGTRAGSERGGSGESYNSRHDLNADLAVDSTDVAIVRSFSGRTCG